jgi:hypothetical protein
MSKQIYPDKHKAATQPAAPESRVGKRAENQQDRIAKGIASGKLTAVQRRIQYQQGSGR